MDLLGKCGWCGKPIRRGLTSDILVCDTTECCLHRVIEYAREYQKAAEAFLTLRGHSLACEGYGKSTCCCGHGKDRGRLYNDLSWAKANLDAVIKHAETHGGARDHLQSV